MFFPVQRLKSRFLGCFFYILVFIVLTNVPYIRAAAEYAKVQSVRGWVTSSRVQSAWSRVDRNDRLYVKTKIRTSKGSLLEILFRSGTRVILGSDVKLQLEAISMDRKSAKQYEGRIDYEISAKDKGKFRVSTPLAELLAEESSFLIDVNYKTKEIAIAVKQGKTLVSNPKKKISPVVLSAGQKLRISKSSRRFEPSPPPIAKPKWAKVKYTLVDGSQDSAFLVSLGSTNVIFSRKLEGKAEDKFSFAKHFVLRIENESGNLIWDALNPHATTPVPKSPTKPAKVQTESPRPQTQKPKN